MLVMNCDYIKKIILSPASKHANLEYRRYFPAFINMVGDGLITLHGEDWYRHRRLLHPAFAANFLKEQMAAVVPGRVQQLIDCWKSCPGRELDIASHFSMLTLDIIGLVGFSHDFHGMESVQEWASTSSSKGKDDNDNEDDGKLPELQDKILESMNKAFGMNIFRMMLYGLVFRRWTGRVKK